MHWRKTEKAYPEQTHGSPALTMDALKEKLKALKPGQYLPITFEAFSEAFPPGEHEPRARNQAHRIANSLDPHDLALWDPTSGLPLTRNGPTT